MAFFSQKRLLWTGGAGLGLAGAAYGGRRGVEAAANESPEDRSGMIAHSAAAGALAAGGLGVAAYASRRALWPASVGMAKNLASWYGRGWKAAFNGPASIPRALGQLPVGLTVGGLAGGLLTRAFSDDPSTVATGVGVGAVAAAAAIPAGARVVRDWQALGRLPGGKILTVGLASMGLGVAARAYMHQPEMERDDLALSTEPFGYDVAPADVRQRLAMLGGTGDVVLGLHRQRH